MVLVTPNLSNKNLVPLAKSMRSMRSKSFMRLKVLTNCLLREDSLGRIYAEYDHDAPWLWFLILSSFRVSRDEGGLAVGCSVLHCIAGIVEEWMAEDSTGYTPFWLALNL